MRKLIEIVRDMLPLQLLPWDEYFPAMAQSDFKLGRHELPAVKSFFIREAPFGGSYALLGGITEALRTISELRFDDPKFRAAMEEFGYDADFLDWLQSQGQLKLQVYAPPEGSLFFPNEPVVTFRGPLAMVRLAEGIFTEALNFPTLSLTKWARLVRVVRPGSVLEFARRRSQNHLRSSFYGLLAGCRQISNSEAARLIGVKPVGTMGHEWMQSFGDVREAFDAWLKVNPHKPIGLVDTLQCLEVDFPAWLDAVYEQREAIKQVNPLIWGWRNDSGNLAYLSIEQYVRFWRHLLSQDQWFAERMRIVLTNDLDEYSSEEIIQQIRSQAGAAGLDAEDLLRRIIWAAGTKPGTCYDQPALGGVAKLMEVDGHGCIKLAFDAEGRPGVKTSIPGFNHSALIRDFDSNEVICLLIYPAESNTFALTEPIKGEGLFVDPLKGDAWDIHAHHLDTPGSEIRISNYRAEARQSLVFDSLEHTGLTVPLDETPETVASRIRQETDGLHWTVSRLRKPHLVKVSVTEGLFELRQNMVRTRSLRSDKMWKQ